MKLSPVLARSLLVVLATATSAAAQQYSGDQGPLGVDAGARIYDTARNNDSEATGSIIIREGDMRYATLVYGYNSDDAQQAPIFATLHDFGDNGGPGYLDGARLMGTLKLSRTSAVIEFTKVIHQDGRTFPISAIAIKDDLTRIGVAGKVNRHTVERYGSLFVAGLLKGAGQAGQLLLDDGNSGGTTIIIGDGSSADSSTESDLTDAEKVAIASVLPIGESLAGVAEQGFNRPPTITAPPGYGMGIVFLAPVTWEDLR